MKYLWAYSIPIAALLGLWVGGIWTFSGLIFAFVVIPLLEVSVPFELAENKNPAAVIFDLLLYLNVILVFGSLWYFLDWSQSDHTFWERLGAMGSVGVIFGANGINVAHELGHRSTPWAQKAAQLLLMPSHYYGFYMEHNHGHHVDVSTPKDPSTAKYNQSVYAFYPQAVWGMNKKAWVIQVSKLKQNNQGFISTKNYMLWAALFHLAFWSSVLMQFGASVTGWAAGAGVVGFLLLETINYIEHYGLMRQLLPSGRYERVQAKHSWNSNHAMGRVVLYELTRHSDHHYKSAKKYPALENHQDSPQLPFGYPTSMLIALIPPLWFRLMNPRVPESMKKMSAV
ncbi:MAG: alkane 1-monooxygenase [Flavobacteriaceae bacterium]|nr:alkane 1-monooxygenase [Flavobacteriaceae bacterium]